MRSTLASTGALTRTVWYSGRVEPCPVLSKTGAVREASEAARACCGSGSGSSGGAAEDMPSDDLKAFCSRCHP